MGESFGRAAVCVVRSARGGRPSHRRSNRMASISSTPDGRRTVQFVAADGKRRSVRLGKIPMKTAQEVQRRIEFLSAAKGSGTAPDTDTVKWLASIGDELHAKLAGVGLVEARVSRTATLGE